MIDDIPTGAALSRNLGSATAPGEAVEREIDAFIEKRAALEDPEANEELWQESVRRYNSRRREENRLAWCDYFERLSACLRARAEEYHQRAQTLMETDQPKGAA